MICICHGHLSLDVPAFGGDERWRRGESVDRRVPQDGSTEIDPGPSWLSSLGCVPDVSSIWCSIWAKLTDPQHSWWGSPQRDTWLTGPWWCTMTHLLSFVSHYNLWVLPTPPFFGWFQTEIIGKASVKWLRIIDFSNLGRHRTGARILLHHAFQCLRLVGPVREWFVRCLDGKENTENFMSHKIIIHSRSIETDTWRLPGCHTGSLPLFKPYRRI